MKKILFTGCGTAIATPFSENGVNFEEFGKLIEFQISERSRCYYSLRNYWGICDYVYGGEKGYNWICYKNC